MLKEVYNYTNSIRETSLPPKEDTSKDMFKASQNAEIYLPNIVKGKENKEILGRNGKILRINLNSGEFNEIDISEEEFQLFLGGKALGMRTLVLGSTLNAEPFEEENELMFATGPLTGYLAGGGASTVITKSPLTETLTDPVCQGTFGYALKNSGYDAIIFKGKSEKPVYALISDTEKRLISAEDLSGFSTSEATRELKRRHRNIKNLGVATIGPAGENQVRFACIIAETRAFGRGGAGAVMGSKNLKAVVVGGERLPQTYDSERVKSLLKEIKRTAADAHRYKTYQFFGTAGIYDHHKELGSLSRENYRYRERNFEGGITTEALLQRSVKKRGVCFRCAINCSRESEILNGPYRDIYSHGPEFETSWALGPHIGNDSVEVLIYAEHLCDEYGLDTISTGGVLALFLECLDKGLVSYETRDIPRLIHQIAYRKGAGEVLAEGSRRAAKDLHPQASQLAVHVKGLETPAYDPRGFYGIALAFSISKRGGCHRKAFCSPETDGEITGIETRGKAKIVADQEVKAAWLDSLVLCKWASANLPIQFYSDALVAITGHFIIPEDLKRIGERAINIAQVFNLIQGYRRKDDSLPRRFLKDKRDSNDIPINKKILECLKDEYYQLRGWGREGIPQVSKLKKLNLEELISLLPIIC